MKLVATTHLAVTHAAATELLAAGTANGLDDEAVFSVLVRFVPYLEAGPDSSSAAMSRCCSGWPTW
jgi:3-hydroxyisobutyrate dehydrogenase-like beta-hydroxyacid dehydrogenase